MENALNYQVDGNHYKELKIQPIELTYMVGGTPCFCKLAKYGSRNKGDRAINIQKALHCIKLEEEFVAKSTELFFYNYPGKSEKDFIMASFLIDLFTEDLLFREALKSMYYGNYRKAKDSMDNILKQVNATDEKI